MRDELLDLLLGYCPVFPQEIEYKERMLSFLKKHGQLSFDNNNMEGHFTASCWLLDSTGEKALLTHHAKIGQWFQLGGHCDGDADIVGVALKEAREESGIEGVELYKDGIFDLDIHMIPASKLKPQHLHYDIRLLLKVVSNESIVCGDESNELRWIKKNVLDLPTHAPSIIRMFSKWASLC